MLPDSQRKTSDFTAVLIVTMIMGSLTLAETPGPFRTLHVAADGSAEFRSIQAALDSIPVSQPDRVVIEIAKGGYNERIHIAHHRVTLRGANRRDTRIWYNFPRTEYDRRYDRPGVGVVNVFGDDVILEGLTIQNTQPSEDHAFALYGQPQRFILSDCAVLSEGGDTVSLWNTSFGMYYHRDCHFRGGVDFVCPRGWCFIRDSRFESVGQSAAIWHDGHMNDNMKFVIRNSEFDGPEQFWIGRNHYPSQFFLLDCRFSERMSDRPIGIVSEPPATADVSLWQRKYFYHCHREGGDFPWHADNLSEAGVTNAERVTPRWTFDGRWDPERTDAPEILSVETEDQDVHVYLTEPVSGANRVQVVREDGSLAVLQSGNGSHHWLFRGGNPSSIPQRLDHAGDRLYSAMATTHARFLSQMKLPAAVPRKLIRFALAGDSTVASYPPEHSYQGWGWALAECFDDRVEVVNLAKGGRSSRSFRSEGWWDDVMQEKADYVIIQFGHNDNPGKGPQRETNPAAGGDFRSNLQQYVEEVRRQGGVPILVSPPTRRKYNANGGMIENEGNDPYAAAVREVAAEWKCPFVDLNQCTKQLFTRLGKEHSDWLQPRGDTTHFTPTGARRIAGLVVEHLVPQLPELGKTVRSDSLMAKPMAAAQLAD